ncbi:MAG: radical SAM protein [bacterium]|nr:radical SAM protein [bacterium]
MTEFHIQWHITDRCNLRCLHCYQEQFTRDTELHWQQLQHICDNLFATMEQWNAQLTIALTGGEPLLKEELWQLMDILSSSPVVSSLSIITNGTVINRYLSELNQVRNLTQLLVSLDGITAETNDAIRGKGTFAKTIANIQLAKEQLEVPIGIMFTLLNRNFAEAHDIIPFAKNLAVDSVILERFIPLGQGRDLKHEVISTRNLDNLYRNLFIQCDLEYHPEEMVKYRALQLLFEKDSVHPTLLGAECVVGKDGMALLPDGTVFPCRRFNIPIGNLLDTSLDELWRTSDVLRNIRNKELYKGACSICRVTDCFGCRAMTYALTGDYLAEDLHCCIKPT